MLALPEHVHKVTAKGKTYYYFHPGRGTTAAGTRIRLPDDPSSTAFWAEIERLTGTPMPNDIRPAAWTFSALIADYKASPEFAKRTPKTQDEYRRHMVTIERIWGARLVRGLKARHVIELRNSFADTPTKADHLVAMLSTLFSFGILRDYAEINVCRDVPDLADSDGYPPWEWSDVEYAREHLPSHLWRSAAVALYTGQRQSDVLTMNWSAISEGAISVRQAKTGKSLWVPLHRELRPILEEIPKRSIRILTNSRGLPWASGFKAAWRNAMGDEAFNSFRERRLVFHGLRKSAVCMLLEAGATDAQVSAVTGQSRQMVEHYSIMVNQRKLARAAILAWEGNKNT